MPDAELAADEQGSLADEVLFRPVRNGNAFEDTVARLLQTIRLGIVSPGEALPAERELATRFSVSRDTVREAIKELSEAGFLITRRGRYGGTFVCDVLPAADPDSVVATAAEIEDVLGLREILEVGAARRAAARQLSAGDRALLWGCLRDSAAASVIDYRRLDSRLHLSVAEMAGTPSLVSLVADNRTRVNRMLDGIPLLARNIEHSNQQHEAIVVAILTGDPEAAAAAMVEHLAGSAALLRGFLT
jgi:DNA-binding FadR family transcriptional regulator